MSVTKLWLALLTSLTVAATLAAEERKQSTLFRALGWAHLGLQAGDFASTEAALASGRGTEANPLMQSYVGRVAVKPAIALGSNAATAALYQSKPKLALWMRVGICVGYGYVIAHNLRIANQ